MVLLAVGDRPVPEPAVWDRAVAECHSADACEGPVALGHHL